MEFRFLLFIGARAGLARGLAGIIVGPFGFNIIFLLITFFNVASVFAFFTIRKDISGRQKNFKHFFKKIVVKS